MNTSSIAGNQKRVAARAHDSNARQPVSTSLEEALRCNVCRHRDAASHASLCRARTIDRLGRWPACSVQPNARGSKRPAIPYLEIPNMRRDSHGGVITVAGDARVTRAGAVLRRSKLDELPQLFNVLK